MQFILEPTNFKGLVSLLKQKNIDFLEERIKNYSGQRNIQDLYFHRIKIPKNFQLNHLTFIFAKKTEMEETQPVGKYWVIFVISAIVQIIFLIWIREYFWMILPWWLTSFSKAMRLI